MAVTILSCFVIYTVLLFVIMHFTARKADNNSFYAGNRRSPWPVVAYGMIGASLSGVTFISVPGNVYTGQFTYLPLVFGYLLGYVVIAYVLLPLYYRLNLTSIYTYLGIRYGQSSRKTGSALFILSRLAGSALRMYLVVFVLYEYVFKGWGVPFWVPACVFILIILLYTFKGGVKTVVWTDTLQTTFLLLAAFITVVCILRELHISYPELMHRSAENGLTKVFETDWNHPRFYIKQLLSGAFITIAMTGLDQDMMQKNLSCRNLSDSRKNILTSAFLFIVVNILFLSLGAALIQYAQQTGFSLPVGQNGMVVNDKIFPSVAFSLSEFTAVIFVLGLVAAGYSSADGTLTALTTTFCFDFLRFDSKGENEAKQTLVRKMVHLGFASLYLLIILVFRRFHNDSLINTLFDIAGYTYGPLLGLFAFGLFTRRKIRKEAWVPVMSVVCPCICYLLGSYSEQLFNGYHFGFEMLLLNASLMCLSLWINSRPPEKKGGIQPGTSENGDVILPDVGESPLFVGQDVKQTNKGEYGQ